MKNTVLLTAGFCLIANSSVASAETLRFTCRGQSDQITYDNDRWHKGRNDGSEAFTMTFDRGENPTLRVMYDDGTDVYRDCRLGPDVLECTAKNTNSSAAIELDRTTLRVRRVYIYKPEGNFVLRSVDDGLSPPPLYALQEPRELGRTGRYRSPTTLKRTLGNCSKVTQQF